MLAPSLRAAASFAIVLCVSRALPAQDPPGPGILPSFRPEGSSFQMPIFPERAIYRFADEAPEPVLRFWESRGRDWRIYWDETLGTPRAIYPLGAVPVVAPELLERGADPAALVAAVEAFVDGLSDLLGIDTARLATPFIHRAPEGSPLRHAILVFQQTTPGGLPVRGANLRVVVRGDGDLGFIKAFVGRGIEDPATPPAASEEQVVAAALERGRLLDAPRLELGFLSASLTSALPIWSLDMEDLVEPYSPFVRGSEHIIDARNGELLARRVVVKHFGGGQEEPPVPEVTGSVTSVGPDLRDPFVNPEREEKRRLNQVEGMIIQEVVGDGFVGGPRVPVAVSREDGTFQFEYPTPRASTRFEASLERGHIEKRFAHEARGTFVPVVRVRPLNLGGLPLLPGEADRNEDGIPEWRLEGEPGSVLRFEINAGSEKQSPSSRDRAHWMLCFEAGRSLTQQAEEGLAEALRLPPGTVRADPQLPVRPVCITPITSEEQLPPEMRGLPGLACSLSYTPPNLGCTLPEDVRASWILAPLSFDVVGDSDACLPDPGEEPEVLEGIVPTMVQHEFGHHIFFHLTNTHNQCAPYQCQEFLVGIEDGVADALTAYANQRPEIGYRYDEAGIALATLRGFNLTDPLSGSFRHRLRQEVAEGFWAMRETFLRTDGDPRAGKGRHPRLPKVANSLIHAWLDSHRTANPTQVTFNYARDLYEELVAVDGTYFADVEGLEREQHRKAIAAGFGSRDIFSEAPFMRGDASLSQKLEITDAVVIMNVLFRGQGEMHDCWNAMDADNSGQVDISDAIRILGFLFLGTEPLPFPHERCGYDSNPPGEPGNLGCREYTCPR